MCCNLYLNILFEVWDTDGLKGERYAYGNVSITTRNPVSGMSYKEYHAIHVHTSITLRVHFQRRKHLLVNSEQMLFHIWCRRVTKVVVLGSGCTCIPLPYKRIVVALAYHKYNFTEQTARASAVFHSTCVFRQFKRDWHKKYWLCSRLKSACH